MWVFLSEGFFSVVAHFTDADTLLVRTRCRSHLDRLQERYADLLGNVEVTRDAYADYPYRMMVSRSVWTAVLDRAVKNVNYPNFKTHATDAPADPLWGRTLHEVWDALAHAYAKERP